MDIYAVLGCLLVTLLLTSRPLCYDVAEIWRRVVGNMEKFCV